MKNLFLLTMLSILFLTSCSTSKTEHIKVAENFTKKIMSGQVEEALKYASEPTAQKLKFAISNSSNFVKPNFKFSLIKDSIHKNESWVKFKNLEDNKTEVLYLIKNNGKWYVHFDPKKQKF
ncbi:nuclear transport factor 2 family protein [Tenacibaculum maritimum]|uniref:hypothetical protein n=1 Tax=Tenacibaculum maritimum TaxID=107401 RepID=UPI0038760277